MIYPAAAIRKEAGRLGPLAQQGIGKKEVLRWARNDNIAWSCCTPDPSLRR